jgi:hypothetical protein
MSAQPNDYQVNRDHDWPSFLETKNRTLRRHIDDLQTQIDYYKQDRWSGWLAAGLLLLVNAIVFYQWLVAGISACGV